MADPSSFKVLASLHIGHADGETRTTGDLPLDARFPIASITKTVVALTAARLATRGIVDWDAEVGPSGFTLRSLLLHTAGLPFELLSRHWFSPPLTDAELAKAYDRPPHLSLPPGTWHYSNLGYALVGEALSRATGTSISVLMREWVLDPLGMTATSFPDPAEDDRERLGAGAAAGGLWSTLSDLGLLAGALDGARPEVVGEPELRMVLGDGTALPDGAVWHAGIRTHPAGPHRVLFASGTMSDRTTGLVLWPRRGLSIFVAERGIAHDVLRDAGIEHWSHRDELRSWWWDGQEVVESRHGAIIELSVLETTWPYPLFSGRDDGDLLRGVNHRGHPNELRRTDATIVGPGMTLSAEVEESAFDAHRE